MGDWKAARAAAREANFAQADAQRRRIDVLTAELECPHLSFRAGRCLRDQRRQAGDGWYGMHAARHAAGRQAYGAEAELSP
jgi:hypothetical protein